MIFSLVSGSLARLCPTPPLSPPCPRLPSRPPSPPHSRPSIFLCLWPSTPLWFLSVFLFNFSRNLLTSTTLFYLCLNCHLLYLPSLTSSSTVPPASMLLSIKHFVKLLLQPLHLLLYLLPPLTFSLHVAPPCPSIASPPISFLHFVLHPFLLLHSISYSSAGVTTLNLSPARRLNPHNRIWIHCGIYGLQGLYGNSVNKRYP